MFEAGPGLVNRIAPWASLLGQKTSNVLAAAERLAWRLAVPGVCVLCHGGIGPSQWARARGGLDLCGHCEAALPRCAPGPANLAPDVPLLAAFEYRPPADFMIRQLKFAGDRAQARCLGLLLAEARRAWREPPPELLVPVPLHWERLRERGFNQAHELARFTARALGVRVAAGALRRTRATQAQSGLPAAARTGNVDGCFAAALRFAPGMRIALLDDVLTTGSTALEAVRTLRAAGAAQVEVWAACRAGRRNEKGGGPCDPPP